MAHATLHLAPRTSHLAPYTLPGEERGGDAHVVLQHLQDGHLQLVDAAQGATPYLAEVAVPPSQAQAQAQAQNTPPPQPPAITASTITASTITNPRGSVTWGGQTTVATSALVLGLRSGRGGKMRRDHFLNGMLDATAVPVTQHNWWCCSIGYRSRMRHETAAPRLVRD